MPLPESDIQRRIQNATDSEVRAVLAALCAESDATARKATKLFSRLERTTQDYEERNLPPPALHICLKCQKPFVEADNAPEACQYHTGIIMIDHESEAWDDHYGDEIHDSEDMREDNPEGFMWSCCEKAIDDPGCARGAHKMGGAKKTAAPARGGGEGSNKRARTE